MEGSIDDNMESVLVGIGREVDDDGDDSNAEAYLVRSDLSKGGRDIPQQDVHLCENYIPAS